MSELLTRETCANHPDRIGEALCDHCGNAMCAACRIEALAAPGEYCSRDCADGAEAGAFSRFIGGLDAPFSTGLKLWWRSLVPLLTAVWPVAVLISVVVWLDPAASIAEVSATTSAFLGFTLLGLGLYGILVTGAAISQQYTEFIRGNVHLWVLRRLVPWVLTWVLVLSATFVGYLLLIVPGVYLALRLFWADEYALAHRAGPFRALKESWELTNGEAGAIFSFQFLTGFMMWVVFMAGLGLAAGAAAVGALLGPLNMAFTFFVLPLVLFVGYAVLHSVQLVKFYGMRAVHLRGGRSGGPISLGLDADRRKAKSVAEPAG